MATLLLHVAGMKDADDERRVEEALRAGPGVFGAVANHQEGCTEVDFDDDEIEPADLIERLENAGFPAVLMG